MTTPPRPGRQLTAAQLARIAALLKSQAAVRRQMTKTAQAAALTPLRTFTAWWDADAVRAMVARILRVVQPSQLRAARATDAFGAQVLTVLTGRTVRPVGAVDITRLRRTIPPEVARDLVDGRRQPAWLELGDLRNGPNERINDPVELAIDDRERRTSVAPEEVYARAADTYRYRVIAAGDSPEVAADKARVRVAVAAATDITLAVREQYRAAFDQDRVTGYRRIVHPELSQTGPCGLCVVAADRIYKRSELLPLHPECVPAGTRVAAEGLRALTRRRYSGSLVVLLTSSGEELTITVNHPVLTDQGWVPAGLVKEGDHVVRHRTGHGVVARSPHKGDEPPRVEDLWRAAVVAGAFLRSRVPISPEDFHGDGSDGEVDAVSTYGLLPRVGDVSFVQPEGELALVGGHGGRVTFAGERPTDQTFLACRHAAATTEGWLNFLPAFSGPNTSVVQTQRLGLVPWLYPGFEQALADDGTFDSVLLGEGLFSGAGAVLLDDLRIREPVTDPPRFDPAFAQFSGEGRHTYAQLGRDLRDRLSGHIELDRVVHQRRVEGTHEVYNLHTVEGWYSANNLVVSNCVCDVLPIVDGLDPGFRLNYKDLQAVYDAAGGTAAGTSEWGLRSVRVALAEHGELGPVLVDAGHRHRGPREVAAMQVPDRFTRARAQLESLERSLAALENRARRGELPDDKPLVWQRHKVAELRAELAAA